eukprot:11998531-Alexandrium_andersonii.AAC.1
MLILPYRSCFGSRPPNHARRTDPLHDRPSLSHGPPPRTTKKPAGLILPSTTSESRSPSAGGSIHT